MPIRYPRREWTIRKWYCTGNLMECDDGRMRRFEHLWERTRWDGERRHGAIHDTRGEGWIGRRRYLPGDPRYGFWGESGDILRPYVRVDGHTSIIYAWGPFRPRFALNPIADLGAHCRIDCPRPMAPLLALEWAMVERDTQARQLAAIAEQRAERAALRSRFSIRKAA